MVYRVVADGVDIFGSDTDSTLISPSLELELNSAGSSEFTLPPDHPAYDDVQLMQTEIEIYEDGDLIFFGRVAEVNIDWFKQKKITCEGALAYLNDAAIRPHTFEGALISDVFKYIIAQYNAQVAQNRQITVGNITIVDRYVYTEFDYDTCLSVLTSTCVDSTGGYLFLRKDDNDVMYIDWLAEVPDTSDQPVQFASNMLDLEQDTKADDVCTVVLPLGGQVDGVNVTIASVNSGSDILENADGIAKYGRILKIHSFGDIVDAQVLKDKAQEWLIKQQEEALTIEADAAELHYLDGTVGAYHLGQIVDVISGPHGINEEYPILKMSMNLDSGTKKVTLGTPPRKELTELSGVTNSTGSGSSSGGGGGGGSSDGVRDVLVNGSSVVSDHVARVSAVTAQQLADGLATKADEDDFEVLQVAVAGKANQADLNALSTAVSGKANQADLNALSTTVAGKQDQLTPGAGINIDANNVISATGGGGTEVEANPSESATDDLNTIKIGNTVYDIPGGGSNANYGKFKCDVLFVNTNGSLPGTSSALFATLSGSISEYDALFIETSLYYNDNFHQAKPLIIFKNDFNFANSDENQFVQDFSAGGSDYRLFIRLYDETHIYSYRTSSSGGGGSAMTIAKVYGLKFENKLINRSDIYSEEERMIGRWTDGKPLYQKTIVKDLTLSSSWQNYYDLTGIDLVDVEINKLMRSDEPIPLAFSNVGIGSWVKRDGYLKFCVQGSQASEGWVLKSATIQYTKTTDSPGSGVIPEDPQMVMMSDYYSEDEQVVGRWTDGKPIYQKTFLNVPLTSGQVVGITHNLGVETYIDFNGRCTVNGDGWSNNKPFPYYQVNWGGYFDILSWDANSIAFNSKWNNSYVDITLKYTKTTDAPGTGPTKGNLIYLPALYSEEEREIGVWKDGKPLYQKNIPIPAIQSAQSGVLISNLGLNIDTCVDIKVRLYKDTTPDNDSVIATASFGDMYFYYRKSEDSIRMDAPFSWVVGRYGNLTIQYTKTTDQPGSGTWTPEGQLAHHYSTSEKIVGTWIDGSTVYERTWDFGSNIQIPSNTWYNTSIDSTNMDRLVDVVGYAAEGAKWAMSGGCDGNTVELIQFRNNNIAVRYLTLQYTKTS